VFSDWRAILMIERTTIGAAAQRAQPAARQAPLKYGSAAAPDNITNILQ
jgi:hypothetical protein